MADEKHEINIVTSFTDRASSPADKTARAIGGVGANAQGASIAMNAFSQSCREASNAASRAQSAAQSLRSSMASVAKSTASAAGSMAGYEVGAGGLFVPSGPQQSERFQPRGASKKKFSKGTGVGTSIYGGYTPTQEEKIEEAAALAAARRKPRTGATGLSPIGVDEEKELKATSKARAKAAKETAKAADDLQKKEGYKQYMDIHRNLVAQTDEVIRSKKEEAQKVASLDRDARAKLKAEQRRERQAIGREATTRARELGYKGTASRDALYNDRGKAMMGQLGLKPREIEAPTKAVKGFGSEILSAGKKALIVAPVWMAMRGAINLVRTGVSDAVKTLVDWESTMGRIKAVTSGTDAEYAALSTRILGVGKSYGVATNEVADAAVQWASAGFAVEDLGYLMDSSAKLAILSNQSMATSVDDLISVMKSYNVSAAESAKIVDMVTAVQFKYVISTKDLIAGMRNFAPVAAQSGVSMAQAMGLITAMAEKTKASGSKMGHALSTVFARMSTVSRDAIQSIAKVPVFMEKTGEYTFQNTGILRSQGDVLNEIASKWDAFGIAQKAAISKALVGTRNFNLLTAMFSSYKTSVEAAMEAITSYGKADKALIPILETTAIKVGKIKASWDSLIITTGGTSAIKDALDVVNTGINNVENNTKRWGSLLGLVLNTISEIDRVDALIASRTHGGIDVGLGKGVVPDSAFKQQGEAYKQSQITEEQTAAIKDLTAEDTRRVGTLEQQVGLMKTLRTDTALLAQAQKDATSEDAKTREIGEKQIKYLEDKIAFIKEKLAILDIELNPKMEPSKIKSVLEVIADQAKNITISPKIDTTGSLGALKDQIQGLIEKAAGSFKITPEVDPKKLEEELTAKLLEAKKNAAIHEVNSAAAEATQAEINKAAQASVRASPEDVKKINAERDRNIAKIEKQRPIAAKDAALKIEEEEQTRINNDKIEADTTRLEEYKNLREKINNVGNEEVKTEKEITAALKDLTDAYGDLEEAQKDRAKLNRKDSKADRKEIEERKKNTIELAKEMARIDAEGVKDREKRNAKNVEFTDTDPHSGKVTRRRITKFGDVTRSESTAGRGRILRGRDVTSDPDSPFYGFGKSGRRRGERRMSGKERKAKDAETYEQMVKNNERDLEKNRLREVARVSNLPDKQFKNQLDKSKYLTNLVNDPQYNKFFSDKQQQIAGAKAVKQFNIPFNITVEGDKITEGEFEQLKKEVANLKDKFVGQGGSGSKGTKGKASEIFSKTNGKSSKK